MTAQARQEIPLAEQRTLRLTPHPLQRVGAYALVQLAGASSVDAVTPEDFDGAVERMTRDAVHASRAESTNAEDGFWLKASNTFFPNSKMNHPSRGKKTAAEVDAEVWEWRSMPSQESWPGEPCSLCRRDACGFYGKVDIPLALSHAYRNTIPPRHQGMALCWACLCSFYALPYGCALGGFPSALHSWDESFLWRTTARRVNGNQQHISLGTPVKRTDHSQKLTAIQQLRYHEDRVAAGVDLLVFCNGNQPSQQFLNMYSLEQPLAEWLRRTLRQAARREGFGALLHAHRTKERNGSARLAHNAFHAPHRILSTATAFLTERADGRGLLTASCANLAELCFSFATEVMEMNEKDVDQIRSLAGNVALMLSASNETGPLKKYQVAHRKTADLKHWFKRGAVTWLLQPPAVSQIEDSGRPARPLITDEQWRLLFDPDGQGRQYQELLFIAVLQELHQQGWRPEDPTAAAELAAEDDFDTVDEPFYETGSEE